MHAGVAPVDDVLAFVEQNANLFEERLCELLRIPSISADPSRKEDVRQAAAWVAGQFQAMGLAVRLIETSGHPLVYAESPPVPGRPTVLVYGHYDVQPVGELGAWQSPPFEPTRRAGNVYARGATDDKGQMLTHVLSTLAWLKVRGSLPLQLKFLIEGEEEVGSQGLEALLQTEEGRTMLSCDVVVVSDTSQYGPGQPAITYGLRGIAFFEVAVRGPRQDLHSGTFGGTVANPIVALCQLLAQVKDEQGRIRLPGFYDAVRPLSAQEAEQLARLPFSEQAYQEKLGVPGLVGEACYTTLQRRWTRPTFDVHGIWGGEQVSKTVIPAHAGAKFSFRLVPDQDPQAVAKATEQFFARHCPAGVALELRYLHGAPAVVVPLDSPWVAAARRAIAHGFGREPVFIREGGSIPIVVHFRQRLGVDTLLLGWGLDDDNAHGPNEKLCLADFHRGIRASARLWEELAGGAT
jgi:succinyl-diaminopimelate desuccinylase